MSQTVSQQEIDSLLSSFGANEPEQDGGMQGGVEPFDFRTPHHLGKRQVNRLQALFGQFGEALGAYLVGQLQCEVSVAVTAVTEVSAEEFAKYTPNPSALYSFSISPAGVKGVIGVSSRLALAVISRLLGGTTEPQTEERPLTKIEQNIFRAVSVKAISILESTLSSTVPMQCAFERYERDIDLLPLNPPEMTMLSVGCEISFADHIYGFNIGMPASLFESLMNDGREGQASGGSAGPWRGVLMEQLERTHIPVSCVLGEARLSLRQLMNLEPGDVVLTGTAITEELDIRIGGKSRAAGRPGVLHGKKAIKITNITESESNE